VGDQDATSRVHRLQTGDDRDLAALQLRAKSYPLGVDAYPLPRPWRPRWIAAT
jgi:hypothetical protein